MQHKSRDGVEQSLLVAELPIDGGRLHAGRRRNGPGRDGFYAAGVKQVGGGLQHLLCRFGACRPSPVSFHVSNDNKFRVAMIRNSATVMLISLLTTGTAKETSDDNTIQTI